MKSSDLKVVAIILAIALFFTIVTSNAVSIASVVLLANGGGNSTVTNNGGTTGGNTGNSGTSSSNGGDSYVSSGDNSGSDSTDNSGSQTGTPAGDSGSSSGDSSSNGGSTSNGGATSNSGNSSNSGSSSSNGGSTSSDEWDKAKTFNFYKAACDKITSTGAAGHTRKEWQKINSIELGSLGSTLQPIIEGFVKTEDEAEEKVSEKGSDDAKRRMAPCGADISYVKSATKKDLANGNYQITIVMNDENTPKKGSNGVAAMATGILYMEDVEKEIASNSAISTVVKGLETGEIVYKSYTIEAEMTKDGKFVTIKHHTTGEINAKAKLLIGSLSGGGSLDFNSYWHDFKY